MVGSGKSYVGPAVQSSAPVFRSTHINARRFPIACVTKTRSFQTIGEEFPASGSATRQTTLFVALHEIGAPSSPVAPFRFGPRHCGQSCCLQKPLMAPQRSKMKNCIRDLMARRLADLAIFPK